MNPQRKTSTLSKGLFREIYNKKSVYRFKFYCMSYNINSTIKNSMVLNWRTEEVCENYELIFLSLIIFTSEIRYIY